MRYLKKSALDYVFDKLVFSRKTFLTFKLNQSILDLLFNTRENQSQHSFLVCSRKHERKRRAARPLLPQPLRYQTMEAGEQPIEKVHLLGQQGRGRRHQPAAVREGGPEPASLPCGKHVCL